MVLRLGTQRPQVAVEVGATAAAAAFDVLVVVELRVVSSR
jgi:hypothetical protein